MTTLHPDPLAQSWFQPGRMTERVLAGRIYTRLSRTKHQQNARQQITPGSPARLESSLDRDWQEVKIEAGEGNSKRRCRGGSASEVWSRQARHSSLIARPTWRVPQQSYAWYYCGRLYRTQTAANSHPTNSGKPSLPQPFDLSPTHVQR